THTYKHTHTHTHTGKAEESDGVRAIAACPLRELLVEDYVSQSPPPGTYFSVALSSALRMGWSFVCGKLIAWGGGGDRQYYTPLTFSLPPFLLLSLSLSLSLSPPL